MSDAGDDETEMFRRPGLDDTTVECLLTGQHVAGQETLASFVAETQLASSSLGPTPSSELAAVLAEGFSTEKGDLSVTAASNVPGPAAQAAGLPERKKNMIELALAKLGALGLAAKIGVATGALVLTGSAAAATGALPDPVIDAIERTGIDVPGGRSSEHREDTDRRQDSDVTRDADATHDPEGTRDSDVATPETPAQADFGAGVADKATSGAPQLDGVQFGEDVSGSARATHQPTDTPTAGDNPGTEHRQEASTQRPEQTPGAVDNPTVPHRQDAGTQEPQHTPTAQDNPGASRRP